MTNDLMWPFPSREERYVCPAGGPHEYALQEEPGTGRTGWACDHCGSPPPKEGDDD